MFLKKNFYSENKRKENSMSIMIYLQKQTFELKLQIIVGFVFFCFCFYSLLYFSLILNDKLENKAVLVCMC
jgi:hypothetical protein